MTTEVAVYDESFKAGADLSAAMYYLVELTGVDTVNVCNAATDLVLGVLQNKPKQGAAARVRLAGISKVVSDGSVTAIAVGDFIGSDASGKGVKKVTAGDKYIGIALDASSANGTIIRVLIRPGTV